MVADDQKKSGEVRRGALMIATAATFLLIAGCDSRPPGGHYQPPESKERQEQRDWEEADGSWHGGHIGRSGGYIPGTSARSGIQADPQTGTVRGGFGKTGAIHASAS